MFSDGQKEEICKRFHLRSGAFYGVNKFKNLWWHLNDNEFGYGDLRDSDILIIAAALEPGEVFKGYNEHHMSTMMQCESPMIIIDCNDVHYPDRVPVSDATWRKIKEEHGR